MDKQLILNTLSECLQDRNIFCSINELKFKNFRRNLVIEKDKSSTITFLFEDETQPLFVLKRNERMIAEKEYNNLSRTDLSPFLTPEPLFYCGDTLAYRYRHGVMLSDIICNLDASQLYNNDIFNKLIEICHDLSLFHGSRHDDLIGPTHGDFSIFDILYKENEENYYVLDWEDYNAVGNQSHDILHFICMLGVVLCGSNKRPYELASYILNDINFRKVASTLIASYCGDRGVECKLVHSQFRNYLIESVQKLSEKGKNSRKYLYSYILEGLNGDFFPHLDVEQQLIKPLSFQWPISGMHEKQKLIDCLDNHDLSMPFGITGQLESFISKYINSKYVVAHCNGTSAMFSALFAAGVGEGDEVICPSYTWWASISPAVWLKATPVFCEIEEDSLTIDIADAIKCITPKTKAIIIPHLWGSISFFGDLKQICSERNIVIIEDASHSFGCTINGKFVGTLGDIGVFSMQMNKPLSAGEGGLMVTNSSTYFEKALLLGHYERIKNVNSETINQYAATGFGLKFRISPFNAAFAAAQLLNLEIRLSRQDALVRSIKSSILDLKCIGLVGVQSEVKHGGRCGLRFIIKNEMHKNKAEILRVLNGQNIMANDDYFHPLHLTPFFKKINAKRTGLNSLPVTENLSSKLISIPLPTSGAGSEVQKVGEMLRHTFAMYEEN